MLGKPSNSTNFLIVGPRQVERVAFFVLEIVHVRRSTRVGFCAPHVLRSEVLVPQLKAASDHREHHDNGCEHEYGNLVSSKRQSLALISSPAL